MSFRITQQFASVSIQSRTTESLRRFGVPPGGAWDRESLAVANVLVGADPEEPALEVIGGSIEIEASRDCSIGVAGACLAAGRLLLKLGERRRLALGPEGFTFYVAAGEPRAALTLDQESFCVQELRVMRDGARIQLPPHLKVTTKISRGGIRLSSTALTPILELPSEPACPGAIQVTPDGTFIIVGPDGPTIGGYPKAGVVCTCDLDKLAHLRPGTEFRLKPIEIDEALELLECKRSEVAKKIANLRLSSA